MATLLTTFVRSLTRASGSWRARHWPDRAAVVAFTALAAALIFHLWIMTRGIGKPLEGVAHYQWRQSQTAISTYYLAKDGIRIDYETPILGDPSSIPFEFPSYQILTVFMQRLLGCNLDIAGRLTSILFFYLTLPLVAGVLRRLLIPRECVWLALTAILLSPVYLFYSRDFLIESTALFFSWMFLWSVLGLVSPARDSESAGSRSWRGPVLALIAVLAGSLAAATKITTFAVHAACLCLTWGAASWLEHGALWWKESNRRRLVSTGVQLCAFLAIAFAVGVLWTRHTDSVKLRNPSPMAHGITSGSLASWDFASKGQRLQVSTWRNIAGRMHQAAFGPILAPAILVLLGPILRKNRIWIAAFILAFLSGPLVFTNLYDIHDYYWYANSIFVAIALGIVLGTLLPPAVAFFGRRAVFVPVLGFIAFEVLGYCRTPYYLAQTGPPLISEIAKTIKERTETVRSLVVFGYELDPYIPYYSERRALMVTLDGRLFFDDGTQQALKNLIASGHPVGAVIFARLTAADNDLQRKVIASLDGKFARGESIDGSLVYFRE